MSAEAGTSAPTPTRRRGPTRAGLARREQILRAAGEAFAVRGFHGAGVEEIAAAAGVSGPALYRHFPSKYALFAECTRALATNLLDAWPEEPPAAADEPDLAREYLADIFGALTRVTLANRRAGGIYRWEGRYLEPDDRESVRLLFEEMIQRVARAASVVRPDVAPRELDLISTAAISVVASLTSHRTAIGVGRLTSTITAAAMRVIDTPAAPVGRGSEDVLARPTPLRVSRRADILAAAVHLFYADGYAEVTIEAIAAEVGLTTSGFYRHFASKSDVLLAACLLASDRLDAAVERADLGSGPREEALARLVDAFVAHSFSHKEQMAVYDAQVASLPAADRSRLRGLQRDHVALWVSLLRDARPGLPAPEARYLVMAAISTVGDLGRRLHWNPSEATAAAVASVVARILADGG